MTFIDNSKITELINHSISLLENEEMTELLESIYLSLNDKSKVKLLKKAVSDTAISNRIEKYYVDKTNDNSEEFKSYFKSLFCELSGKDQYFVNDFIHSNKKPCLSNLPKGVKINVVSIILDSMRSYSIDTKQYFNEEEVSDFLIKCLLLKFNSSTNVGRGELFFILFFSNTEKGNSGDIYVTSNNITYEIKGFGAMYGEKIFSGKGRIKDIFKQFGEQSILEKYDIKSWSLSGSSLDKIYEVLDEHKRSGHLNKVEEICKTIFGIYADFGTNVLINSAVLNRYLNDKNPETEFKNFIALSYYQLLATYIGENVMIVTDIQGGNNPSKYSNKGECVLLDKYNVNTFDMYALSHSITNVSCTYQKNSTPVKIIPPGDSDQGYRPMLKLS